MKRPSGRCTRGGVGATRRSSCDERPSLIRPVPLNQMPTLEGRLCSQYFSTGVSGVPPSRPTPPNSKGRRVAPVNGKSGLGRLQRQHERVTRADRVVQELVNRFHIQGTPKVTHLIASEEVPGQS